ncbi:MAG: hypothetical protein KKB51_20310 [Candidatus Riflebacteria bacterium]|nr:hypothetical protein [Candidatus Riflebacteria bacterium]
MKFNLLKALLLTASFFAFCLSLDGQPLPVPATSTAEQLFQEALSAKKDGNIDNAITLYENAVKSSSTVLAKDDDGLVQAARESREKQFNLSPENSEAFDNLDFVYRVCLGDQRGMFPFLKKAYAATEDAQRKTDYKARIDQIELEMAEEAAWKERAEQAAAEREAAAEKAAAAKKAALTDKSASDSPIRDFSDGSAKTQNVISEEDAEAAAEKAAAIAAAKKEAAEEAAEEAKNEKLNEELALNTGKMRRLDVRLKDLAELIELKENNLSMVVGDLENAQQEFSMNASAANRKEVEAIKLRLKKAKKDLETQKQSFKELQELRSAYHARKIRAKRGLGIISDED